MNITKKIIITDTNIITDLDNAGVLSYFVELDNVYISDMVKNDEINFKTGNIEIINKFKVITTEFRQLNEVIEILKQENKLSYYDLINYVVARDNNGILATGDNRLKNYAEEHGTMVIRTLKIIKLMKEKKIITTQKAIKACELLLACDSTRIPKDSINDLIGELEKDLILV